jgi:PAS domain-containing protein
MDPPFTKLDLLCCRNLLIYLTPELHNKLLPIFHYCLNPGGVLFLGSAETIGTHTNLFAGLAGKTRLYRRRESGVAIEPIEFPTNFIAAKSDMPTRAVKPIANLQTLADELLLQTYSPAAALTNDNGDILYISGRTGKYLEPAAGKANWNIFAMAREGLRYELTAAFRKALLRKETVTHKNIVVGSDGGKQALNITVQPISGSNALDGMVMIVFTDVATTPLVKNIGKPQHQLARTAELARDLEQAHEEVQSIRQEMLNSQEEFKSINEELQSTNEELQSANEELTTSKEEMQSMNEELHTVNQELQSKLTELSRTNNDMKNLLDSTDIATLFLDNRLCVRRFTSQTSKITKLIPSDVGRPITDIASALLYPDLGDDAHEVLRTLVKVEKQIPTPDGSWFAARILPYRTLENMIDGVVITFTDISAYKKLEAKLRGKKSNQQIA